MKKRKGSLTGHLVASSPSDATANASNELNNAKHYLATHMSGLA